jgi:hypothetical protein
MLKGIETLLVVMYLFPLSSLFLFSAKNHDGVNVITTRAWKHSGRAIYSVRHII